MLDTLSRRERSFREGFLGRLDGPVRTPPPKGLSPAVFQVGWLTAEQVIAARGAEGAVEVGRKMMPKCPACGVRGLKKARCRRCGRRTCKGCAVRVRDEETGRMQARCGACANGSTEERDRQ